ncbi:MAG: hypothetical protein KDB03_24220, partial [Planctomycetales bacterium]|nr:hypothetical protein [Planctomycetales bacterium]
GWDGLFLPLAIYIESRAALGPCNLRHASRVVSQILPLGVRRDRARLTSETQFQDKAPWEETHRRFLQMAGNYGRPLAAARTASPVQPEKIHGPGTPLARVEIQSLTNDVAKTLLIWKRKRAVDVKKLYIHLCVEI